MSDGNSSRILSKGAGLLEDIQEIMMRTGLITPDDIAREFKELKRHLMRVPTDWAMRLLVPSGSRGGWWTS